MTVGGNTVVEPSTIEGRVVDGPILGARVFIDLNDNGIEDDGEPSGVTNETGRFSMPTDRIIEVGKKIIAIGGIDTVTGENTGD